MPKLHTLNKPASHSDLLRQLSAAMTEQDSVLLLEDGVYHLLSLESSDQSDWKTKAKCIYALKEDVLSRGAPLDVSSVQYISYTEFVELSTQHSNVISWY